MLILLAAFAAEPAVSPPVAEPIAISSTKASDGSQTLVHQTTVAATPAEGGHEFAW